MAKKNYVSGFGEKDPDAASFLKPDRSPWDAEASGHQYNAKYDDDTGFERGAIHADSDTHGLVNKLPDEAGANIHERLAGLIDDSQPYDPLLPGGSPLTHGKSVGDGKVRYAPKSGPIGNMRRPK